MRIFPLFQRENVYISLISEEKYVYFPLFQRKNAYISLITEEKCVYFLYYRGKVRTLITEEKCVCLVQRSFLDFLWSLSVIFVVSYRWTSGVGILEYFMGAVDLFQSFFSRVEIAKTKQWNEVLSPSMKCSIILSQ